MKPSAEEDVVFLTGAGLVIVGGFMVNHACGTFAVTAFGVLLIFAAFRHVAKEEEKRIK